MEDILIEKTSKTPCVSFSYEQNALEIKGVSIPEDADSFYAPLMEWVSRYVQEKKNQKTIMVLKLVYFNTSTSDYLVTMLKNLKKLKDQPLSDEADLAEQSPEWEEKSGLASSLTLDAVHSNHHPEENEAATQADALLSPEDAAGEENPGVKMDGEHPLRILWYYEEE
ncbi:MAG: DUF1987 domain-containing protein, partial [Bacteroidia bacterium]|nr:DUF1987 domain-containing protein [Bacteroidia bacterium]